MGSAEPTFPAFLDIYPGTPERVTLGLRALLPPPVASEKSRDHQTPQPEGGLSPWGGLCGPRGWGGVALFIFVRDPCEHVSASPTTPHPAPCRPALLRGRHGHTHLLSEHHGEHTLPPALVKGLLLSEARDGPAAARPPFPQSHTQVPSQRLGSPHTLPGCDSQGFHA